MIPAYETLYALALVGAAIFGPGVIARVGGMPVGRVRRLVLVLTLTAFAGARAFFVATNWSSFADAPWSAFAVWRGGRNAVAAIATLLLVAPTAVRGASLPAARFCDAGVPVVSVALAIARIGCFLHGCCSGVVASCPWCIRYPPRSAPYQLQVIRHVIVPGTPSSLAVHPLQLYFAGLALGIATLAVWWMRRRHRDGDVTLGCTLVFGLGSAALEGLRADHPTRLFWVGVPALEWLAIALVIGATIALWWRRVSQPTGFIGG